MGRVEFCAAHKQALCLRYLVIQLSVKRDLFMGHSFIQPVDIHTPAPFLYIIFGRL